MPFCSKAHNFYLILMPIRIQSDDVHSTTANRRMRRQAKTGLAFIDSWLPWSPKGGGQDWFRPRANVWKFFEFLPTFYQSAFFTWMTASTKQNDHILAWEWQACGGHYFCDTGRCCANIGLCKQYDSRDSEWKSLRSASMYRCHTSLQHKIPACAASVDFLVKAALTD